MLTKNGVIITHDKKENKDNSLRTNLFLNNIWEEFKSEVQCLKTKKQRIAYLNKKFE